MSHILKVIKTQSDTAQFYCSCGQSIQSLPLKWLAGSERELLWAEILSGFRKHRGDCFEIRYPMMHPCNKSR